MKKIILALGVCASLGASVLSADDQYVRASVGYGFGVDYGYNLDTKIHKDGVLSVEGSVSYSPFVANATYLGLGVGVRYTHHLNDKFYLSGKLGGTFVRHSWSVDWYDGTRDYSSTFFGVGTSFAVGYKLNKKLSVGLEGGYVGTGAGGLFVRYSL